jgi:hypothetical protein
MCYTYLQQPIVQDNSQAKNNFVDDQGVANVGGVQVQQHTQFDAEFQLHKLVDEAFTTYDRLQQVLEVQILAFESENLEEIEVNNTPPKSPIPIDVLWKGLFQKPEHHYLKDFLHPYYQLFLCCLI